MGGYKCPMSNSTVLVGIACLEFSNNAPILASAAEETTHFKILAIFSTAPLSLGSASLFGRKKWPPALLLAFSLHRLGCVAMYVQHHVASLEGENCVRVSHYVIDKLQGFSHSGLGWRSLVWRDCTQCNQHSRINCLHVVQESSCDLLDEKLGFWAKFPRGVRTLCILDLCTPVPRVHEAGP